MVYYHKQLLPQMFKQLCGKRLILSKVINQKHFFALITSNYFYGIITVNGLSREVKSSMTDCHVIYMIVKYLCFVVTSCWKLNLNTRKYALNI